MGQAPSAWFHRAAMTALWVSAVAANARSSAVSACSMTARHAVAPSFSIRTARRAASAGLPTSIGSW